MKELIKKHKEYISKLNTSDWESSRTVGIGGSDVGVIVGHSKYKTPYSLYQDKKGNKTFFGNNLTHWGHNLEEAVAKEFSNVMNIKVKTKAKQFKHKQFPWLIGYVDRLIVRDGKSVGILECKTSQNAFMFGQGYIYKDGKEYDGEFDVETSIPLTYLDQVQHYMYISGLRECYLAVLIQGAEFRVYKVPYIEEIAKENARLCTHFWFNHIIPSIAPQMTVKDYQEFTADRTEKSYQLDISNSSKAKELAIDYHRISSEIKSLKDMIEDYEKYQDDVKIKLLELLPTDTQELLDSEGNPLITVKPYSKKEFNSEKFKIDNPKLFAQYYIDTVQKPRITVKKIKDL